MKLDNLLSADAANRFLIIKLRFMTSVGKEHLTTLLLEVLELEVPILIFLSSFALADTS